MNIRCLAPLFLLLHLLPIRAEQSPLWSKENLDAWCIVPFDAKKRTPAQRSEMVVQLGLKRIGYDWRENHVTEFEEEILQYQKHGIEFFAFWGVHPKAFELFAKYKLHPQIWLMAPNPTAASQEEKVRQAAAGMLDAVEQTRKIGSKLAIYNHGGWNGEPENMAAIAEYLRKHHQGDHVGIVYNFHHGHAHIADFAAKWKVMQPYLFAVNLNGMEMGGDTKGRKILHLSEGDRELEMLRVIEKSGWIGPVGIIDHREETDSEITLQNNLAGLEWLRKELVQEGSGGAKPSMKSGVLAAPKKGKAPQAVLVPGKFGKALDASEQGLLLPGNHNWRGGEISVEAWVKLRNANQFNVIVASDLKTSEAHWELYSYNQAGDFCVYLPGRGGEVRSGQRISDDAWHHVAMVLEQSRVRLYVDGVMVKEQVIQAAAAPVVAGELGIGRTVEPGIGCVGLVEEIRISKGARKITVPDAPMTNAPETLLLFQADEASKKVLAQSPELAPINASAHPLAGDKVNRDRIYDFYAKQARDWHLQPADLLPPYPGLDGGKQGHWGNQDENTWRDGRWNSSDLNSCLAGVFRDGKLTVAKAVCVKLEEDDFSACFDPLTAQWKSVWSNGFLKFSDVRHGLMDGLRMAGMPRPEMMEFAGAPPPQGRYRGYYRHGKKVVFAYENNGQETLQMLQMGNRRLNLVVGDELRKYTTGGKAQWPEVLETKGVPGQSIEGWPLVVDTLAIPFENPWKSLFFIGGHDFFSNGDMAVCTMTGDVWRVSGVDASLSKLRWKRLASGLHQPLGLLVVDDKPIVLGRDQITRLHDLNGDGEADFYECVTNDFNTPTGGHDYLCGLERDAAGSFYTASGKEGLLKITPGGKTEVVASGFRNPDGFGLSPTGVLTVPYSEGEWTPTSAIAQITPGGYYGYPGPKKGVKTEPPLLWLPRGVDNSAGGQVWVPDDRWGPLKGQMIHLSYGTGNAFLVLRQQVGGIWQGAAVPLPGDFSSGAHRGRFSPKDGQLYVSGMTGWGTYTPDDGSLQRVRYTGGPMHIPTAFEARDNGLLVTFSDKLDASATNKANHFAQCWNYRYSAAYGSPELSLRHPDKAGHDVLQITSAHVIGDGRQLFLEIPQLQPAGQVHVVVAPQSGLHREMVLTIHQLGTPFTEFPGYNVIAKTLWQGNKADSAKTLPSPFEKGEAGRAIRVETAAGLQFATNEITAKRGERLSLNLANPDVLPHNWVLVAPGALEKVGDLSNKLIADPQGFASHYVPAVPEVLAWTVMINPQASTTIHFTAPVKPGDYPYICTFPGHWMVMKGVLRIVE